jgi:hypothetical protein
VRVTVTSTRCVLPDSSMVPVTTYSTPRARETSVKGAGAVSYRTTAEIGRTEAVLVRAIREMTASANDTPRNGMGRD